MAHALPTGWTGYGDWFTYMNTVTDGFFWSGITVSLWIITFLALKNFHTEKAFAVSCFVSFIVQTILSAVGVGNAYLWGASALLTAASVFALKD